jgi:hypothetical protein
VLCARGGVWAPVSPCISLCVCVCVCVCVGRGWLPTSRRPVPQVECLLLCQRSRVTWSAPEACCTFGRLCVSLVRSPSASPAPSSCWPTQAPVCGGEEWGGVGRSTERIPSKEASEKTSSQSICGHPLHQVPCLGLRAPPHSAVHDPGSPPHTQGRGRTRTHGRS